MAIDTKKISGIAEDLLGSPSKSTEPGPKLNGPINEPHGGWHHPAAVAGPGQNGDIRDPFPVRK